jgi:hypothetical protein
MKKKFDKDKFMADLKAKLPNSDVFELTMEQKTAALNHLRAVNANNCHIKSQTWIGRDYKARLDLIDTHKQNKKYAVMAVISFIVVLSVENAVNSVQADGKKRLIAKAEQAHLSVLMAEHRAEYTFINP